MYIEKDGRGKRETERGNVIQRRKYYEFTASMIL